MTFLNGYSRIYVLRRHNQKSLDPSALKPFSSSEPCFTCIFTFAAGHFWFTSLASLILFLKTLKMLGSCSVEGESHRPLQVWGVQHFHLPREQQMLAGMIPLHLLGSPGEGEIHSGFPLSLALALWEWREGRFAVRWRVVHTCFSRLLEIRLVGDAVIWRQRWVN